MNSEAVVHALLESTEEDFARELISSVHVTPYGIEKSRRRLGVRVYDLMSKCFEPGAYEVTDADLAALQADAEGIKSQVDLMPKRQALSFGDDVREIDRIINNLRTMRTMLANGERVGYGQLNYLYSVIRAKI